MYSVQNNLLPDRHLLWHCGLLVPETSAPDKTKISIFFSVSESTANRWISKGLPKYARKQLSMIINGTMLPSHWRGIRFVHDGIWLDSGHHVPLKTLRFLPFILHHVDWAKVPSIAK